MNDTLELYRSALTVCQQYVEKYAHKEKSDKQHNWSAMVLREHIKKLENNLSYTHKDSEKAVVINDICGKVGSFIDLMKDHSVKKQKEQLQIMLDDCEKKEKKQKFFNIVGEYLRVDAQMSELQSLKKELLQQMIEYNTRENNGNNNEITEKLLNLEDMDIVDGKVVEGKYNFNRTENFYNISNINYFEEMHGAKVSAMEEEGKRKTMIINVYGSLNSGKTESAISVMSDLRRRGYKCEYLPSYTRELKYDNPELLDGTLENQKKILGEQIKRMDKYIGKVDYLITEHPILENAVYLKENDSEYIEKLMVIYNHYSNFNYVAIDHSREDNKDKEYQKAIREILDQSQISPGLYEYENVGTIVNNIMVASGKHTPARERPKAFKAIAYMKQNTDTPVILYGNDVEDLINKMKQINMEKSEEEKLCTCYVRMYNQEKMEYENAHKYNLETGKDITPIYLNIPHMSRNEFLQTVKKLKENGARFNPIKKAFYVTQENNLNKFSEYLPIPGFFGANETGRPTETDKLNVKVKRDILNNRLVIKVKGLEDYLVEGKIYSTDFSQMSAEQIKDFTDKYILTDKCFCNHIESLLKAGISRQNTKEYKTSIMDTLEQNKAELEVIGKREKMEVNPGWER